MQVIEIDNGLIKIPALIRRNFSCLLNGEFWVILIGPTIEQVILSSYPRFQVHLLHLISC